MNSRGGEREGIFTWKLDKLWPDVSTFADIPDITNNRNQRREGEGDIRIKFLLFGPGPVVNILEKDFVRGEQILHHNTVEGTFLVTGHQQRANLEISQLLHLIAAAFPGLVMILQTLHQSLQSPVMIITRVVEPKLAKIFDVSHDQADDLSLLEK